MADVLPNHKVLTVAEAAALDGTEHSPSGITFISKGTNPNSSPSLQVQLNRMLKLILDLLDNNAGKVVPSETGVTHVGAFPMDCPVPGASTIERFEGASGYDIGTTNGTYKVWIDRTSTPYQITHGASYPASKDDYLPLAEVVIAGNVLTTIQDERSVGLFAGFESNSTATGTNNTSFTIDADNAGAEADMQIAFNRGSTAGDATLRWDAANNRFEIESDESVPTLAEMNALAIVISGTTALDSNGAAKVAAAVAGDGLSHSAGVLAVGVDGSTTEISSDQVIIKDGGVTTAKLSTALQDKLGQVTISDASGSSPQGISVQILDIAGNNLAEEVYVEVGVYQDADGAATATDATIAAGAAGSLVAWSTTNKVGVFKTNASGLLNITVTDGTTETIYLLASPSPRSKLLDCSDIGTVTIS